MSQTSELTCCEAQPQKTSQARSEPSYLVVQPRVDVVESAEAWILRADMPGVDSAHADVSLERSVLAISGVAELREPEGFERRFGTFRPRRYERSFRLPEATTWIDTTKAGRSTTPMNPRHPPRPVMFLDSAAHQSRRCRAIRVPRPIPNRRVDVVNGGWKTRSL